MAGAGEGRLAIVSSRPIRPCGGARALGPGGQGTAQVRERTLLQTLLDFPALVVEQQETLARIRLETPRFAAVMAALVEWAETGPEPEGDGLRGALAGAGPGRRGR